MCWKLSTCTCSFWLFAKGICRLDHGFRLVYSCVLWQTAYYLWLRSTSIPPINLLCWFNQPNIVIHRQYIHLQRWYLSPSTCTHSHSMQKLCYTCGQFHTYVSDTIWRGWALSRAHTNNKLSESSSNSPLSYRSYHRSGKRWWASISFVIPVVSFLVILITSFEFIRSSDITGIVNLNEAKIHNSLTNLSTYVIDASFQTLPSVLVQGPPVLRWSCVSAYCEKANPAYYQTIIFPHVTN